VDWVVFVVAALAILVGAFGVILSSNPVHSALMLVMTLFGVAVLFVAQQADFLAAVQVIVYAGAIVVLFLFVIMLLGVDRSENLTVEPLRGQRVAAAIAGALALIEVLFLAGSRWATGARSSAGTASGPGSNVEKLARSLFTRYLLAFEATSVLLVIAVVGAVVLAQRNRADDASLGTSTVTEPSPEPAPSPDPAPAGHSLGSGTEPAVDQPAAGAA
jgi:NADH-quinone oxidoreductase subunit J